jgi:hypothetical protein
MPDTQGSPTGDSNYVFAAFATHRIVVNTCGYSAATISTVVRLYVRMRPDRFPTTPARVSLTLARARSSC